MAANAYFATRLDFDEPEDWSPEGIANRFRKFFDERLTTKAVAKLDFVEHVAYLLYLKIDNERSQLTGRLAQANPPVVPAQYGWSTIAGKDGEPLRQQFTHILDELSKPDLRVDHPELSTTLAVFREAQPWSSRHLAALKSLITDVIDGRDWSPHLLALGKAFELLLAFCRNEIDTMRESGQVITPRPLLQAVAQALAVTPADTVLDPAAGTGGALLAAYRQMALSPDYLPYTAYAGCDLDARMVRLATMNILLNTRRPFSAPAPIQHTADSLAHAGVVIPRPVGAPAPTAVICNPPFKSNVPRPEARIDLWKLSSAPANFLQHIATGMPLNARAAVFIPDSVLFDASAETILRALFDVCDVHTLLRLPENTFRNGTSKSGVKANILFFNKVEPPASGAPATSELWVYDARSNSGPELTATALDAFVAAYRPGQPTRTRTPTDKFGPHSVSSLHKRGFKLHNLPAASEEDDVLSPLRPASEIAAEIADSLTRAQKVFADLATELP